MEEFDKVKWPNRPFLPTPRGRARGKRVVKRLCGMGKVLTWLEGRRSVDDLYLKMPHTYEVDGIKVRFLPHWDNLYVGRMTLPASNTKRQILRAIRLEKQGKPLPENF